MKPLRLTTADFDAFLERTSRPTSASPAAQRRALRERIATWAREVIPRFTELGIAMELVVPDEVEQHLSSRAPRSIAQRVLFMRDAFARGPVPRTEPQDDPLPQHAPLRGGHRPPRLTARRRLGRLQERVEIRARQSQRAFRRSGFHDCGGYGALRSCQRQHVTSSENSWICWPY